MVPTEIAGSVSDTLIRKTPVLADKGTLPLLSIVPLYFDNTAAKEFSTSAYSPERQTRFTANARLRSRNNITENVQVMVLHDRTPHQCWMRSASATQCLSRTGTPSFLIRGTRTSTTVAAEIDKKPRLQRCYRPQTALNATPYYPGSYVFKDMSNA